MRTENWIVMPREKDLANGGMYFKHLELITPERALVEHGLLVESPIFINGWLNIEDGNLIYISGEVIRAPKFSPRKWEGIVFYRTHRGVLTNSSEVGFHIQERSWVVFPEAIGRVYTKDEERIIDYRLAKAVRIEKIEAHCAFCARDNFLNIPLGEINLPYRPLSDGFAYDEYPGMNGSGILRAICDVEKHAKKYPWVEREIKYRFQISDEGEFSTTKL